MPEDINLENLEQFENIALEPVISSQTQATQISPTPSHLPTAESMAERELLDPELAGQTAKFKIPKNLEISQFL